MNNLKDEILNLSKNLINLESESFDREDDDNFMGFGPTILFKKILHDKYKLRHDTQEMKNIYNEYLDIFDIYEEYKDIDCINCFSYMIYIEIPEDKKEMNWWIRITTRIKIYLYNLNKSCRFLEKNEIEEWINRLYIHKSFFSSFNEIEPYLDGKEIEIHNDIENLNIILDKVNNLLPNNESYKKKTSSPTTNRLTYDDFYFLTCTKNLRNDDLSYLYSRESNYIRRKFRLEEFEHLKQKLLKPRNVSEIPSVGVEFSSDSRSSSVVSDINPIEIDNISTEIKESIEKIKKNMDEIYNIKKDLYMIKLLLNFLLTSNYCELFFINFDEEKLSLFNYKQLRIIRFHPFYDRTIKYSICRDIDGFVSPYDWCVIAPFTNNEKFDTIFYSLSWQSFFEIDKNINNTSSTNNLKKKNNTSSTNNLKKKNNTSSTNNLKDKHYLICFKEFLNTFSKQTFEIEENKDAVYFYGEYALWQNTFQKCLCSMEGREFPASDKYHENSILSLVDLKNKESYSINNLNYCPFPMIACLFGTKFKLKRDFVLLTIDYLKNVMIEINKSIDNFYWFKKVPDDKFSNRGKTSSISNRGKTYVKTSMQTGFDEILLLLLFQFKGMKVEEDILKYKDSIERNIVVEDDFNNSTVNGRSTLNNEDIYNFLNELTSNKFRLNVFNNIVLANLYKLKDSIRFEKNYNQMKQTDKKLLKNQSDLSNNEKDELSISKNLLRIVIEDRQSLKKTLNEQKISSSITSSSITENVPSEKQKISSSITSSSITENVPSEKQKISSSITSSSIKENVPNEYQGLRNFLKDYKTIVENRNRQKNRTGIPSEDTGYKLQEVQSFIREMIKETIN